jgi:DNA (cytosine-5)-methyltransferase 1
VFGRNTSRKIRDKIPFINNKMKVLNLYSGIGGNRKLWEDVEVTAVEYDEKIATVYQNYFPDDKVIIADAHQYLLEHFKEFDFIWSSPPCPTHSRLNTMLNKNGVNHYPDMKLYQEIIFLKHWFYGKYVVENVIPYYTPLIVPSKELHRHYFWTNFRIGNFKVSGERIHTEIKSTSKVYGFDLEECDLDDKAKCLKNMVDPELSLYLLNCARDIIKSQDVLQKTIFD